jgi:TolB-like protein/class 3 adenylate cyclase/Tfp pilus assembly protein PilF
VANVERKLAAILSADVVGYSRLMAEDEPSTIQTLNAYRSLISSLVDDHHGRVVDSPGDNLLAEFPNALDAVQCAVEVQGVLRVRNQSLAENRRMLFRIGIHLGDITMEGDRVYGDGVNIAARLEGLAEPGGICISGVVHSQVHSKLNLQYRDLGEQQVKNIAEPVQVYQVGFGEVSALEERPSATVRALAGVGAVLVAVAAVAGWWLLTRVPARVEAPVPTETAALELPDKPSIAVLPFANMSDDPGQEYFSDGISEDLITDLSRISGLFVISRNSSFFYKGKQVKIEDVGRELGVRYVVEGSVRKANDRVRITAQLVDATTGGHVWADRYDRKLEDIFALQDEVTGKIVDALEVSLTESERAGVQRIPTENLEAWDYFQRGNTYVIRFSKESTDQARKMYERAIALDPEFAWAHATLAWTHLADWLLQWSNDPDTRERAFEIAQRALALDDSVGIAHSLLAYQHAYNGHYQKAIARAEKAVLLNPSDARGLNQLAVMLMSAGRPEESIPPLRKAMRLNPQVSFMYLTNVGESYRRLGRHEEAIDTLNQALVGNPDYLYAHLFLAGTYVDIGEQELARREASEVLRISPRFSLQAMRRTLASDRDAGLTAALRKAGLPE